MLGISVRNFFVVEKRAVLSFRIYSFIYCKVSKLIGFILYNRSKLKYGIDIAPTAKIGKGFSIAHLGGIVIGRNAVLGDNCAVNNNVTLGMKSKDSDRMPVVGNNVYISTGAKLLGDIHIGDGSIVGANSVVLESFGNDSVIVGVPAINKIRASDN